MAEDGAEGHLEDVRAALQRMPKVHLQVLDAVIVHLTHTDVPRMHRRFNHTQDNHIHLEVRRDLTHAYRRIDTDLVFRPVRSSKYCWPLPAKHLMSNVCTALSRHCHLDSAVVA